MAGLDDICGEPVQSIMPIINSGKSARQVVDHGQFRWNETVW
jgi:hypothetical protein